MYASHFGLSAEPFDLVPNPAYLYLGPQYQEASAALAYGLAERRGFVTLIGEVGTGKTTLLYNLLADLPEGVDAAFVSYAGQPFPALLSLVLSDLSVAHDPASEGDMLAALERHLRTQHAAGRTVALVIDEAQHVADETLERLRLLSNVETAQQKLLQIVLVGQPELQDRLRQPHLRQLNERIGVRAQLRRLPAGELRNYVAHRLRRVGGDLDRLCTPTARRLLLQRAAGIPRRANILFHNALLFAYGKGAVQVTLPIARAAIRELNDAPIRGRWSATSRWAAGALAAGVALVLWGQASGSRPIDPPSPARVVAAPCPAVPAPVAAPTPAAAELAAVEPARPAEPTTLARLERPAPDAPGIAVRPLADAPAAAAVSGTADPATSSVRIHPGATLGGLARELYGAGLSDAALARQIDEILRLNPQVRDPDRILAGGTLRVPAAEGRTP